MIQERILENPFFYKTHAFKDQVIQIIYHYPKIEPQVSLANLLSYVMVDRCEKYPSKQSMSAEMDRLYGLSLSAKTASYGNVHTYELKLKTLSAHFIDGNTQSEVIDFLHECLYHPLFTESGFLEAKINMKAALMRLQDQASIQGYRLAIESVSMDESIKTYSQGSLDVLENLTLNQLIDFHKKLIETVPQVFFSNTQAANLSSFIENKINLKPIKASYVFSKKDYVYSERERALPQSTLTLMFTTQKTFMDGEYLSLRLLSMILGQLPNSLLFQEVREKHSLCYSIHAQLFSFDGLLGIQTGIDFMQKDKAKEIILLQIERLKKGDFTQKLLKVAKKMYVNNLKTMKEDRSSYFYWLQQMALVGQKLDIQSMINEIHKITKNDIQKTALKLELISESLIKGENHA